MTLVKNSATGIEAPSVYSRPIIPGFCPAKGSPKPKLGEYIEALETSLLEEWRPSFDNDFKAASVLFKVDRDGNISHLQIFESSGDNQIDLLALKAVEHLKRFKPLPAYSPACIDITFRFGRKELEQKKRQNKTMH